ncbi:replication factor C large subunit [Candidatus Pacearchaeota archaeon]|nr:replication factor C large subunit [Candidatus Pacearchaeota archaeon]
MEIPIKDSRFRKGQSPLPLIEKYRAKSFSDIKGQDIVIEEIKAFFQTFPKKKALILNGPVGTGKTSMVLALGKEQNLELFELNASDLRNRSSLEAVLKPSTQQQSLFKKGKLILMDEADGITTSDRGGLPELLALIDKTSFPIIITANDIWQKKFNLLRKKCQLITLKELNKETISEILKNVLQKENKQLKPETQNIIIELSKGDVRAALNDLQSALISGEETFVSETHEREKEETIFNVLKKVFQEPTDKKTISVYNNLNQDLNEISLWIEENIPTEYSGQALAKAYDSLSRADLFKGRIYRQQYWRFLVYQNIFLSYGISSAKRNIKTGFTSYKKPTRILKIWLNNQKNIKKKSIAEKYAQYVHIGKKRAMNEFQTIKQIIKYYPDTQKQLKLNEEEIEYIMR